MDFRDPSERSYRGHPKKLFLLSIAVLVFALEIKAQEKYDSTIVKQGEASAKKVMVYPHGDQLYIYAKPKLFGFITQIPRTYQSAAKLTFRKKSIPALSLIVGTTLALVAFDQPILDGVRNFSNTINLDPTRAYKSVIRFNLGSTPINVYDAPQNFNSVLYSIGEGSTSILLCGGLYAFGKIKNDYRALQTASQIMQAQLVMGFTTQLLKRISGRESPFRRTAPGGVWSPLRNPSVYQKNVSRYDAFPSGHMGTMMATTVVLIKNYPEKKWLKPVAFGLMGIVGFAMINNEVHWAGDYPLALGLGYVTGLATVKLNRWVIPKPR